MALFTLRGCERDDIRVVARYLAIGHEYRACLRSAIAGDRIHMLGADGDSLSAIIESVGDNHLRLSLSSCSIFDDAPVDDCAPLDLDVDAPPDFGRHQMPPEMVPPLSAPEPDPALSAAQTEMLHVLAEECGEVVQRVTKILRFGMRANPWDGKHNREELEREMGDFVAAMTGLMALKVIGDGVFTHAASKIEAYKVPDGRLVHAREAFEEASR